MNEPWRRSTGYGSDRGTCVECRADSGRWDIRDFRHLTFPAAEWRPLIAAVHRGEP